MNNKITSVVLGFLLSCAVTLVQASEFAVMIGQGEHQNLEDVYRAEVRIAQSVFEFNTVDVSLVGHGHFSATEQGDDDSLDFSDWFVGGQVAGDYWSFDLLANERDYWAKAEGRFPLMKGLDLKGGVIHKNAHDLPEGERRLKTTRAFVGADLALSHRWGLSAEYYTGNHGARSVHDAVLVGGWFRW